MVEVPTEPPAGTPFLVWRDGDGAQQILILEPGRQRATIGRTSHSDIALPWDLEVSRTHALLERVGDEWTVIDDGLSRNGSSINGDRVCGRQRLRHGDRLVVGRTHVTFHSKAGPDDLTGQGVREPRRPTPPGDGGAIQLPPPEHAA